MGALIVIFITAIVALTLFVSIAQTVGHSTNNQSLVNYTFTTPAINGTIDLVGQELFSTPIVINSSSNKSVVAANYSVYEGIGSDGVKGIIYKSLDGSTYTNVPVKITYSYGDDGYIDDSGGRSVAALIVILSALAIGVITLVPSLRSGLLELGK